jgi:competence protein ComEC
VARGQGRVWAWPVAGSGGGIAWPLRWPQFAFADRFKGWALSDVAPGRLIPWLPVCFGFGIALYFTARREPAWWAGVIAVACGVVATYFSRRRPIGFPAALAATTIAAGFATVTLKALWLTHPILTTTTYSVDVAGFVEVSEERERSDRIVIRVHQIAAARLNQKLERVRVSVKKGTAPPVGAFVSLKARLNPPLAPLRPGGYDYSRDLYFQGIGAIGFALGSIKTVTPPVEPSLWLRYAAFFGSIRDAIDKRIRAAVPGDAGAIASALITGKRDAITTPVNDAMYISSLAHVLSISGYHMVIVAGVVFFMIRAGFALIPGFAERHPIKKWAALAALFAAAFYLLLSGAEVATQRSFIMTAVVLIGVMADRAALTLRTLSVAALAVLVIAPQALVHPSFQMSFAATLALIAGYRFPWFQKTDDTPLGARLALWGVREIVSLIFASMLAGTATMPFAAYHFHRLAPYGVIANLLAMPIVSAFVMPAGLLALVAMPFGFDGFFWQLMGLGIDWMIAVALWVASLPGSVGRMSAFGVGPLLLCSAGLILVCLLRSPLRWTGALLMAVASLWAIRVPLPDVLISGDGQVVAVRNTAGTLSVLKTGNDAFSVREWLAADADARNPKDKTLTEGVLCDAIGCATRLLDGRFVVLSFNAEALAEDCEKAALVVSPREAAVACVAMLVDRKRWRQTGALSLRRDQNGFAIEPVRPAGTDRPWAPQPASAGEAAVTPSSPAARTTPRDATPKPEDLQVDD